MNQLKLIGIILLLTPITSHASDLVHSFGSPSFSGIGQSQHFLSIAQIEHNRKEKIQDDIESAEREAEREEKNKTIEEVDLILNLLGKLVLLPRKENVHKVHTT